MDTYEKVLRESIKRNYSFVPPTSDINDESWKKGLNLRCDIPGWNNSQILLEYARLAKEVPENGIIIEVGCGLGLCTWPLVYNSKDSVKTYAIDRWSAPKSEPWFYSKYFNFDSDRFPDFKKTVEANDRPINFNQAAFDQLFYKNEKIKSLDIASPPENWGNGQADLIIIDVHHTYIEWFNNIMFWSKYLKPNGVIAGCDYFSCTEGIRDDFREIHLAINDAAAELGKKISYSNSLFWTFE